MMKILDLNQNQRVCLCPREIPQTQPDYQAYCFQAHGRPKQVVYKENQIQTQLTQFPGEVWGRSQKACGE